MMMLYMHFHVDYDFSLVNLLESKLLLFLVVIGQYTNNDER